MPHLSTPGNWAKGGIYKKVIERRCAEWLCRRCEAEFQNELITAFRKGMPRRVVALIRAGGDVTRYWHWRALRTPRRCLRRGYINLAQEHQNGHFAVFALCDYKREKRGRATDRVIPLRDLPCLSYDCYFISRFFLVNRDTYGKIEKSLSWVQ